MLAIFVLFRHLMLNRYLGATFKVVKKIKVSKGMWAGGHIQRENFWLAERVLTYFKLHGEWGELVLAAFSVVPQKWQNNSPTKPLKQFPSSRRSTEPGGGVQLLRSATGRDFRVLQQPDWSERRSLWLVARVRAADLSWEWRAVSSLQLCEQGRTASLQPVSTCMMSQVLGFSWRLRGGLFSSGKLCRGFHRAQVAQPHPSCLT